MSQENSVPPLTSAQRKAAPVYRGFVCYFPDAIMAVAAVSKIGNDKHNPGQELHWAKGKSQDEPDCELRHMIDNAKNPGGTDEAGVLDIASKAWRAMADLQRFFDAHPEKLGELLDRAARGSAT